MCKQHTDEISSYIYTRLKTRFPELRIKKSRSSNSAYIYQHLLYVSTCNRRYHLKAFTVRVSDHGGIADTNTNISVFKRNVSTKDIFSAYERADQLIEELKNLNVQEIARYVSEKIGRKEFENKKLRYYGLRDIVKEAHEMVMR